MLSKELAKDREPRELLFGEGEESGVVPSEKPAGKGGEVGMVKPDETEGKTAKDDKEKEKRKTFDPDSEFFRNWDIFTTLLLVFTAVVTPFEVRCGEVQREP
jgi:hypothetical protein